MTLTPAQTRNLAWMGRNELVALLEPRGIPCFEGEPEEGLRETVRTHIEHGHLSPAVLD